jgi:hypothetical protein
MNESVNSKTLRQFVLVWFGQLISLVGSGPDEFFSWSLGISAHALEHELCLDPCLRNAAESHHISFC